MNVWQAFTTVGSPQTGFPHIDTALVGIASVAAVAWTGGLVAQQLKQYTLERSIGMDILQASFMGAIFGLFLNPLPLRIVATVFTVFYVLGCIGGLCFQFRDMQSTRRSLGKRSEGLSDELILSIHKTSRRYFWYTLLTLVPYLALAVWPYPLVAAWLSTAMLFAGFQTVLYVLNVAPDRDMETTKMTTMTTMMNQLGTVLKQLDVLIRKP